MITCSRDALQDQKDRASLILKFNSRLKLVIGKGKVYRCLNVVWKSNSFSVLKYKHAESV